MSNNSTRRQREKITARISQKLRENPIIPTYCRGAIVKIPKHLILIDVNRPKSRLFGLRAMPFTNLILILVDKLMFSFQNERCIKYGS